MFQPRYGDRPGVPNYAVIITDGGSNDKEATFQVNSLFVYNSHWHIVSSSVRQRRGLGA